MGTSELFCPAVVVSGNAHAQNVGSRAIPQSGLGAFHCDTGSMLSSSITMTQTIQGGEKEDEEPSADFLDEEMDDADVDDAESAGEGVSEDFFDTIQYTTENGTTVTIGKREKRESVTAEQKQNAKLIQVIGQPALYSEHLVHLATQPVTMLGRSSSATSHATSHHPDAHQR